MSAFDWHLLICRIMDNGSSTYSGKANPLKENSILQPKSELFTPCMQVNADLNDLYKDNFEFEIYVEGVLLCTARDFKEAVLCVVAAYFVFNIEYDTADDQTLILFEKLFLEADKSVDLEEDLKQIIKTVKLKAESDFRLEKSPKRRGKKM